MRLWLPLLAVGLSCCAADDLGLTPGVQPSSSANPSWQVDINRIRDGIFRTYSPRCEDSVRVGQTVEFRNFMPEVPANVTSIAGPRPLYSPNLRRPYNYFGPEDADNPVCEEEAGGVCVRRAAFSYWRFTFDAPGVYDWIDTNSSNPGRQVVDPYYGTVTFVGIDPNSPFGTLCVYGTDRNECDAVCCATDTDCNSGNRCFRTDVDAVGRCLTPSG